MTLKRKVLVADASKVVRASLAKQLAEYFDVREEASGESAWQTLVLDSAIVGVVSGMNLTRLDGLGLLERLRASKLSRLKSLPFFLVVSNSFGETERMHARNLGVTDFVAKDSSNASMESLIGLLQTRVDDLFGTHDEALDPDATLVDAVMEPLADEPEEEDLGTHTDVGVSDILGKLKDMQGLERFESAPPDDEEDALDNANPVYAQEKLDECLARALPSATKGKGVGILAFGVDKHDELVARYGAELVARTVEKFSFMVARKIRPEDVISQLPGGRVVIVAPDTNSTACASFANRICKAMATAQIAVRGQRIDLTVSAGISVLPEDGATLARQELLNLAYDRLREAQRDGGNQVAAKADYRGAGRGSCDVFVPRLKDLMASTDPAVLRPCLGTVGLQLMPLLRELERTLRLGMPIDNMNKRLWDRARTERMG
ncbi:diguanylate cyclase [Dechloromonas sp. XY25]|uniref:Diguanylate cyclase n=1 Tax=Dechloromonas hankyongensis TaxID=2908002 RepID=A0ABS9K2G8_9RHOO|nr:diguanylate cyclase [Dechloromonas hankyongensis]MCG2577346.1 diguanylate cyclase [Dechloromonas hankyongensis]